MGGRTGSLKSIRRAEGRGPEPVRKERRHDLIGERRKYEDELSHTGGSSTGTRGTNKIGTGGNTYE